jgi:hypothetical protein
VRVCCEPLDDGLLPALLVLAGGLLAPLLPVLAEALAAGEDELCAELVCGGVLELVDATVDVAWCVIGRGRAA